MKSLVFDTSSIISLSLNNLLWTLRLLKKNFKGEFYIPDAVKGELIDVPIQGKKYKLEAMQVSRDIIDGVLKVGEKIETDKFLKLINSIYTSKKKTEAKNPGGEIQILQKGEVEALLLVVKLKADALVVDERTTRLLLEDPEKLKGILEKKLHTEIDINYNSLNKFKIQVGIINVIRSTELMMVALEKGLLKDYIVDGKKELVDAILWGLRLRGCSISDEEIGELIKIES